MADETKLRVNCFVNDGRKLNGRRAVLNKRWHWKQCLRKVAEKVDANYNARSTLYTTDGVVVEDVDELLDGETVFFAPEGEAFVEPAEGGGGGGGGAGGPMAAGRQMEGSGGGGGGRGNAAAVALESGGGGGARQQAARPPQHPGPSRQQQQQQHQHQQHQQQAYDEEAAVRDSLARAKFVYLFKFIVVGSASVGKSCLLLQFTDQRYKEHIQPTVGVDFGSRTCVLEGQPIKVQVWDTAGQEDFRAITRAYYREAAAALLCYDVSDRKTFRRLKSWLSAVRTNATNDQICITLVGNKIDLGVERRVVSTDEGREFAMENNMDFVETSAKTGQNVEEAFLRTAATVYRKIRDRTLNIDDPRSGVRKDELQQQAAAQGGGRQGGGRQGSASGRQNLSASSKKKKDGCC